MIARLRLRMTLLVSAVLILVSAGIVISINYMNWYNITEQAENALETLTSNSGIRPQKLRDEDSRHSDRQKPEGERKRNLMGQPVDSEDVLADLGNYYVVTVDEEGGIIVWESDRKELYSDEQVEDITEQILSSSKTQGRIGTQFFRLTASNNIKQVIILDERLEIRNAGTVLKTTLLIASLTCLMLCTAAYWLIGFMIRPVQEAFEKQKQFVWDASHELKTPLAVIGANAQVLEGEIGENEYLGYIQSEVSRTAGLLSDLLTLARMDERKTELHLTEADLGKTVMEAVLPFESAVFEAGKILETEVPDRISCYMDIDKIRQLIVILLSNALKYSDKNGTIRVLVTARGKNREIRVTNTGAGIAPQDLARIFDRFYRADAAHSRDVEGFGLGLSIAKNIVEAHKGKINVESKPGGMTDFIINLPE